MHTMNQEAGKEEYEVKDICEASNRIELKAYVLVDLDNEIAYGFKVREQCILYRQLKIFNEPKSQYGIIPSTMFSKYQFNMNVLYIGLHKISSMYFLLYWCVHVHYYKHQSLWSNCIVSNSSQSLNKHLV